MGFVIRSAAVIGLIYLVSPLRPPMPEWLAHPASLALSANMNAQKSQDNPAPRATPAPLSSKTPETISIAALKATMETAGRAVATVCAGHEKSCLEIAAHAVKATTEADPLAALIGPETAHASPVSTGPHNQLADATPAGAIPLPPAASRTHKKKI